MAGAIRTARFDPAAAEEEFWRSRLADRPAAGRAREQQQRPALLDRNRGVELIECDGGGRGRRSAVCPARGNRAPNGAAAERGCDLRVGSALVPQLPEERDASIGPGVRCLAMTHVVPHKPNRLRDYTSVLYKSKIFGCWMEALDRLEQF